MTKPETPKPEGVPATAQLYRERSERFAAEAARFGRHDGKLVAARGLTFFAGAFCMLMAYLDAQARPVWIAVGTVMFVLFLALAVLDDWRKRRRHAYWSNCSVRQEPDSRIFRICKHRKRK